MQHDRLGTLFLRGGQTTTTRHYVERRVRGVQEGHPMLQAHDARALVTANEIPTQYSTFALFLKAADLGYHLVCG